MIKRLFLDSDGVLADFIGGVIRWYGFRFRHDDCTDWYSVIRLSGMTADRFWDGLSEKFWARLDKTEHADWLVSLTAKYDPVILTAPQMTGASGKQEWIFNNFPTIFGAHRYLIGPAKKYCASPGAVLIDDSEKNCQQWASYGGDAILFPAPWNENHDKPVREYVADQLKCLEG